MCLGEKSVSLYREWIKIPQFRKLHPPPLSSEFNFVAHGNAQTFLIDRVCTRLGPLHVRRHRIRRFAALLFVTLNFIFSLTGLKREFTETSERCTIFSINVFDFFSSLLQNLGVREVTDFTPRRSVDFFLPTATRLLMKLVSVCASRRSGSKFKRRTLSLWHRKTN